MKNVLIDLSIYCHVKWIRWSELSVTRRSFCGPGWCPHSIKYLSSPMSSPLTQTETVAATEIIHGILLVKIKGYRFCGSHNGSVRGLLILELNAL